MDNAFIAQHFRWDCHAAPRRWRFVNKVLRKLLKLQLEPASYRWENANVEARMNAFHLAQSDSRVWRARATSSRSAAMTARCRSSSRKS